MTRTEDEVFWDDVIKSMSIKKIWKFIHTLYPKDDCSGMDYWPDDGRIFTFTYQETHCCSITLADPPHWLAIKLVREYLKKRKEYLPEGCRIIDKYGIIVPDTSVGDAIKEGLI